MHAAGIQFVETSSFTRRVVKYLSHRDYLIFQRRLMENPEEGDVVAGTGGFRKVRVARSGEGKSGGYRVIYYYITQSGRIHLIDIFAKKDQSNLTGAQKAALRKLAPRLS